MTYTRNTRHTTHIDTFVLFCILAATAFLFWQSTGRTTIQLMLGAITVVSYIVWGIVHHHTKGDLHMRLVIEYILVGLIGFVLLATLAL